MHFMAKLPLAAKQICGGLVQFTLLFIGNDANISLKTLLHYPLYFQMEAI